MNFLAGKPSFYPYYDHLSSAKKAAYDLILSGISALTAKISLAGDLKSQDVFDIISAIYYDHPELFWMNGRSQTWSRNDYVISVEPVYTCTPSQAAAMKKQLEAVIATYLSAARFGTLMERERIIHDKMVNEITYIHTPQDQNAYGALVEKKAVCAGYTRAFQLLMQRLGIPCYYCTGSSKNASESSWGSHAWNILMLDHEFYNMDITWDDCYDKTAPGKIAYTYYNCTDLQIGSTHKRSRESAFLPACNGVKKSFSSVTGIEPDLEIIYQDGVSCRQAISSSGDFEKYILPQLRQQAGKYTCISFPIKGRSAFDYVTRNIDKAIRKIRPAALSCTWTSRYRDYRNGWYRFEITIEYK